MVKRASSNAGRLPARVLVAEDDTILALALEDALLDAGVAEVVICPTTQEALESLRRRKPDAIVLDVHLADRDDGWAIAELVSSVGPRPPRIVFSTGAPADIPEEIAELGDILAKPYHPDELLALLARPRRRSLFARLRG